MNVQQKLIAIAVAGLASSAMAQTNVSVYGNIDLAIVQSSGTSSGTDGAGSLNGVGVNIVGTTVSTRGSQTRMDSGMRSASRVGFKGTENLGGGLKASFVVESQLDASGNLGQAAPAAANGVGLVGGREATLGLEGGFGSISFGRMGAGNDFASFDAAGSATTGTIDWLMYDLSSNRTNNTITYVTPDLAGFKATYQVSMSENQDKVATAVATAHGTQTYLDVGYSAGPLLVKLGQTITRDPNGQTIGSQFTLNNLGVAYDFGVARLSGQYATQRSKGVNGAVAPVDANTWQVGVKVPTGAHTFSVNYVTTNDKRIQNSDANSWYLGYDYAMSKRTTAYLGATAISNKNGATFSALGLTGNNTGSANTAASRTQALFAGMNHTF